MAAMISPQLQAVGESTLNPTKHNINNNDQQSYAKSLNINQTAQTTSKLSLKPIHIIHGEPTIQFTMEERQAFAIEEGLHQAVVVKVSPRSPGLHDLRNLLPKFLGIKGHCLVGQLAPRQLLIRLDQYEDFVTALARAVNYFPHKGEEHQYRIFPWTIGFNPNEETTMAVVWISLPNLSPELFARKSLLSIASAVGKPIAIDKATHVKSRPSTARVRVIVDLVAKLPQRVRLQHVDNESGKVVEVFQEIVYDNLPGYCNVCKHQGHVESTCRLLKKKNTKVAVDGEVNNDQRGIEKLQGDAREYLNTKLDRANEQLVAKNNAAVTVLGQADALKEHTERDATKNNLEMAEQQAMLAAITTSTVAAAMVENAGNINERDEQTVVNSVGLLHHVHEEKEKKMGDSVYEQQIDVGVASTSHKSSVNLGVGHLGRLCQQNDTILKQHSHGRSLPTMEANSVQQMGQSSTTLLERNSTEKVEESHKGVQQLNNKSRGHVENKIMEQIVKHAAHMDTSTFLGKYSDTNEQSTNVIEGIQCEKATAFSSSKNGTKSHAIQAVASENSSVQSLKEKQCQNAYVSSSNAGNKSTVENYNAGTLEKACVDRSPGQRVTASSPFRVGLNTSHNEVPSNDMFDKCIQPSHNLKTLSMISSASDAHEYDKLHEAVNSRRRSWADIAEEHDEGEENSQDFRSSNRQSGKGNEGAVALNTSVYEIPSQSMGSYGSESGQLMLSTGNNNFGNEEWDKDAGFDVESTNEGADQQSEDASEDTDPNDEEWEDEYEDEAVEPLSEKFSCANLKREQENRLKQRFQFASHRVERVIKDETQISFFENSKTGKLKNKLEAPDFIPNKLHCRTCLHFIDTPPNTVEDHIGTSQGGAIWMKIATMSDKRPIVRRPPMRAAKQKQAAPTASRRSYRSRKN